MPNTVLDLMRDLQPSGLVYLNDPRFPFMLRLHKTSLLKTLGEMKPRTSIKYEVRNPEGTGHYSRDRRHIILSAAFSKPRA